MMERVTEHNSMNLIFISGPSKYLPIKGTVLVEDDHLWKLPLFFVHAADENLERSIMGIQD